MQEQNNAKVVYKTIVVPADGSENSKRALQHAVSICERNEAQLVIVHVANIVSAISNFDQTPIEWRLCIGTNRGRHGRNR